MNLHKNKISYILLSIMMIIGVFSFGVYMGYSQRPEIEKITSVINKEQSLNVKADFSPFWKAWNVLNEKSIYNKVTDEEKIWGAIQGLASSTGDPYTTFFNPEDNKSFKEEIKGSFSGIGAEIGIKDQILTVVSPLKNSPAEKSGLKAGDKVLKIDNKNTTDISVDKAISLIRGEKGTIVTLTILRKGEKETKEIKIERDIIDVPVIETEKKEDEKIFIIKFYSFTENADNLFAEALTEFESTKYNKLILDLRGNPGGYLDIAVRIASWFLDEGKVIVSEDFGESKKGDIYRSRGPRLFNDELKLVVLIDGGSASASEILAGALREHGVATLVGEKTFGKGSVQDLVDITPDTSLKVTVAKWLTPKGVSISDSGGLEPDVKVILTPKDYESFRDPQMDKAIEILKNK